LTTLEDEVAAAAAAAAAADADAFWIVERRKPRLAQREWSLSC